MCIVPTGFHSKPVQICTDKFSHEAAAVACRQMGLPLPALELTSRVFGGATASQRIWLDDVVCTGTEVSLDQCKHNTWGIHDCSHNWVAAIACNVSSRRSCRCLALHAMRASIRAWMSHHPTACHDAVQFRLANRTRNYAGRLEAAINGVWGTVRQTRRLSPLSGD